MESQLAMDTPDAIQQATALDEDCLTEPKLAPSETGREVYERHYELMHKRILHAYDSENSSFATNTAIIGALFGSVGFVVQALQVQKAYSWIAVGISVTLISGLAIMIGKLMRQNAHSRTHYKAMLNAGLVRLECAILPDAQYGTYCQIVADDRSRTSHPYLGSSKEDQVARSLLDRIREDQKREEHLKYHSAKRLDGAFTVEMMIGYVSFVWFILMFAGFSLVIAGALFYLFPQAATSVLHYINLPTGLSAK